MKRHHAGRSNLIRGRLRAAFYFWFASRLGTDRYRDEGEHQACVLTRFERDQKWGSALRLDLHAATYFEVCASSASVIFDSNSPEEAKNLLSTCTMPRTVFEYQKVVETRRGTPPSAEAVKTSHSMREEA
jgi:hypothetical protein